MTKYPQRLSIIPAIGAAADYHRSNHAGSGDDGHDYIRAESDLEDFHKAFFEFKAAIHPITHCDRDDALEYFDALESAWLDLSAKMLSHAIAHCPEGKT